MEYQVIDRRTVESSLLLSAGLRLVAGEVSLSSNSNSNPSYVGTGRKQWQRLTDNPAYSVLYGRHTSKHRQNYLLCMIAGPC